MEVIGYVEHKIAQKRDEDRRGSGERSMDGNGKAKRKNGRGEIGIGFNVSVFGRNGKSDNSFPTRVKPAKIVGFSHVVTETFSRTVADWTISKSPSIFNYPRSSNQVMAN
jgi:hypothetical protein